MLLKVLNSFNPELQLKDTESAIKIKLIDLLTQLKAFKFVTTLALVFKKIESEDKQSIALLIQAHMQNLMIILLLFQNIIL